MSTMRLDKFLAQAGVGTRSEVKKILKGGAVAVNGTAAKKPEQKIDAENDRITYQGRLLSYEPFIALMFHKPAGCVTATADRSQKTVMDYIRHERKSELFPVGRLDIDTEGLLLLMNDGDLAHRMLSPRHHVEKTYYVRGDGALSDADVEAFAEGIDIGEKRMTLPARLELLFTDGACIEGTFEARVTICEGRFHQVKRMFAARGCRVTYLKRIAMAGLTLDEALAPGEWRELTDKEKLLLRELTSEKSGTQ